MDPPDTLAIPKSQPERLARLAERMLRTGQWSPAQAAGRRWTVGCVSLEITQRCNLDCSLCYLSDSAEAVRDIPLEDLFRRIDGIALKLGPMAMSRFLVETRRCVTVLSCRRLCATCGGGACAPRC